MKHLVCSFIPRVAGVLLVAALAGTAGCDRRADAVAPGDGTFRAEKARAEAARNVAEDRCEKQRSPAREDCLTRAESEYGRLVAAAELRRDAREVDLPEIAKTR
jgi:hypothetical protein